MGIDLLVAILFGWNLIGFCVVVFSSVETKGAFGLAKGFEFTNPIFIYKHNNVNWFGAIVVCLLYSLLCPVGTICYWFYKLCTVGRKQDE